VKGGSSVNTVTSLRAGRQKFNSRVGAGIFFSMSQCPQQLWSPPRLLLNGYRGLFTRW